MKKSCAVFAAILSAGLILSGCANKNNQLDTDITNEAQKNADSKDVLEYQEAYDSLIHFGRLLREEKPVENPKEETARILYLCLPPVYDFLSNIENLPYERLEKPITDFLIKQGHSAAEAKKIYENGKILYPLFKSTYASDNFDIFAHSDMIEKFKGRDVFDEIEFVEENPLTKQELNRVDNDLKLIVDGDLKEGFEALGIDTDMYTAQKGYKVAVKIKDETKDIIFYYMDGDWRIYIPQIFEEIKNLLI